MITWIKFSKYKELSAVSYFRNEIHITYLNGLWIRYYVLLRQKNFVNQAAFGAVELIFCKRNACLQEINLLSMRKILYKIFNLKVH